MQYMVVDNTIIDKTPLQWYLLCLQRSSSIFEQKVGTGEFRP